MFDKLIQIWTKIKCGFVMIFLKKGLYKPQETIYNADRNKEKQQKMQE